MHTAAFAVSLAVQALAVLLFAMGIVTFATLVKGGFVLRRMALAGRHDHAPAILKSPLVPAVSTIALPPDASAESLRGTRRLLDLHFGRNEVVIVLDGPSEADLETWTREFRLCASTRSIGATLETAAIRGVYESRDPIRVVVIDKARGGPADAWNAGVNAAASPVIALLDRDGEFQAEVLLRLMQPMLEADAETIAVCGGVPAPPAPGFAARFGALESLRTWLTLGAAFAGRNLTMPFPGCAMLVRRSAVEEAGGFTGGVLELVLRLHAMALAAGKPYRIAFLPTPVSHVRTPATFGDLRRQMKREQREMGSAFRKRVALAGPFGWRALRGLYWERSLRPKLEIAASVLAAAGLAMGWVDVSAAVLVLLSTVAMGMVISMAAVAMREVAEPASADERRMAALFLAAIPENLGYRHLRNLWLIAGFRKAAESREQSAGRKSHELPPARCGTS
jgi:glycosyltransferase involved in cell wall biosynthesis